jgi:hypothetical protein
VTAHVDEGLAAGRVALVCMQKLSTGDLHSLQFNKPGADYLLHNASELTTERLEAHATRVLRPLRFDDEPGIRPEGGNPAARR